MTVLAPQKKKKSTAREILEWGAVILCAVAAALIIRSLVFEPVRVIGSSMAETLHDGEIMLVTKYEYLLGDPKRFDIVICNYPNRSENFVKRVVGLPGDTVLVKNGTLYVNGEAQEEGYITHAPNYAMDPYVVPEGEYFVLGDNRSNSNASHILGSITRSQIKGHVRSVFFPFDTMRDIR